MSQQLSQTTHQLPIAILGRGCLLPGADNPNTFFDNLMGKQVSMTSLPPRYGATEAKDSAHAPSMLGGFITDDILPNVDTPQNAPDSTAFGWSWHALSQAIAESGIDIDPKRTGLCMGHLMYPSYEMNEAVNQVWLDYTQDTAPHKTNLQKGSAKDRWMGDLPLQLANALNLCSDSPAFALDAACASALYALKFGCHQIQQGVVDVMLVGAMNIADPLFLQKGFRALGAYSTSGQSRPFHAEADGLIPSEGVAFFVLAHPKLAGPTNPSLGWIRGIGLSNDGRGKSLLAPDSDGQCQAIQQAYALANIDPKTVEVIECHATGTQAGDATELASIRRCGLQPFWVGSHKGNIGHALTASGAFGLLKLLGAFEQSRLPPTITQIPSLPEHPDWVKAPQYADFRIPLEPQPWVKQSETNNISKTARRAALSAFGFGGNNAHLIIDGPEFDPTSVDNTQDENKTSTAIKTRVQRYARTDQPRYVHIDPIGCKLPPKDLELSLGQQRLAFAFARDLLSNQSPFQQKRLNAANSNSNDDANHETIGTQTAVILAIEPDTQVSQYAYRWRHADLHSKQPQPSLQATDVLGTMPNLVANRISVQHDFRGPSFVISGRGSTKVAHRWAQLLFEEAEANLDSQIRHVIIGGLDLANHPTDHMLSQQAKRPVNFSGAVMFLLRAQSPKDKDQSDQELPPPQSASVTSPSTHWIHTWQRWSLNLETSLAQTRTPSLLSTPPVPEEQRVFQTIKNDFIHSVRPATLSQTPPNSWTQLSLGIDQQSRSPHDQNLITEPQKPKPVSPALASTSHSAASINHFTALTNHSTNMAVPLSSHSAIQRVLQSAAEQHQTFLYRTTQAYAEWQSIHAQSMQMTLGFSSATTAGSHQPIASSQTKVETNVEAPLSSSSIIPQQHSEGALNRQALEVHSSGQISSLFGPQFIAQDGYPIQVRMPEPPLLLADRITRIDAPKAQLGTGSLVSETDVGSQAWYLHEGRMPAGIMIESGQADLLLISYMGIDLIIEPERAYRLLGCELTYLDSLPRQGETLSYDIHIDGHAQQGDVRLFFFHYDCVVNGRKALRVRQGQAGFFTKEELANSEGILWDPQHDTVDEQRPWTIPTMTTHKRSFNIQEVKAFADRKPWKCFAQSQSKDATPIDPFMLTQTHHRSPSIASGRMLFLEGVDIFSPQGGPWGRGYLRAETVIDPNAWYFKGHFKNDPCMPGTLMFEACLQTMAFYMAALGLSIDKDGWRFEPVPHIPYQMRCRGQVTPDSKRLRYEVFVREIQIGDSDSGQAPTLFADLLCTVDGLKAFHAKNMGLRLVPDWPNESPLVHETNHQNQPEADAATFEGLRLNKSTMLNSALARPSSAFGPSYKKFDGLQSAPRLPGPPLDLISRITHIAHPFGRFEEGANLVAEYDVDPNAWFFYSDAPQETIPFGILTEIALQPCGWLASSIGSALQSDRSLFFRNLDGDGTLHRVPTRDCGTLKIHATVQKIAQAADLIIETFDIQLFDRHGLCWELQSSFGFFTQEALQTQAGLSAQSDFEQGLSRQIMEAQRLSPLSSETLPTQHQLWLLDTLQTLDGRGHTSKDTHQRHRSLGHHRVRTDAWFFKAHFFQDPVQPGSLGLEMMHQALAAHAASTGFVPRITSWNRVPGKTRWSYRGQVRPLNRDVHIALEDIEHESSASETQLSAKGTLWCDGTLIYRSEKFSIVVDATKRGA